MVEEENQLDKYTSSSTVEEENQLDKIYQAAEKAFEQLEEEKKDKERDYISEWYRWVELTKKNLKNKLNWWSIKLWIDERQGSLVPTKEIFVLNCASQEGCINS